MLMRPYITDQAVLILVFCTIFGSVVLQIFDMFAHNSIHRVKQNNDFRYDNIDQALTNLTKH